MKTAGLIEGLLILDRYRKNLDGYNVGTGHDIIYAYAPETPLNDVDLSRMVKLGWFQDDVGFGADENSDGNFHECHYDPDESWAYYV